jgi:hypothetical protein
MSSDPESTSDVIDSTERVTGHVVSDYMALLEVFGFCVVIVFFSVLITQLFVLYLSVYDIMNMPVRV